MSSPKLPPDRLATRVVVGPAMPAGDHKKEEAAAEVKATAMARTFGQDHLSSGGCASLEERVTARVMGFVGELPGLERAPDLMKKFGKYGGPTFASLAFGFSAAETAVHWKQESNGERAVGVATTAASGVAAATTVAAATGVAGAGALVAPAAGLAGSMFAAVNAWKTCHSPYTTAGQRGMSLVAAGMQAAGTAMCLTPLAPVGVAMMLSGASAGMFGGYLGELAPVERTCKALGLQGGSHAGKKLRAK